MKSSVWVFVTGALLFTSDVQASGSQGAGFVTENFGGQLKQLQVIAQFMKGISSEDKKSDPQKKSLFDEAMKVLTICKYKRAVGEGSSSRDNFEQSPGCSSAILSFMPKMAGSTKGGASKAEASKKPAQWVRPVSKFPGGKSTTKK